MTISGYSPGHRLLKEIAKEIHIKWTYDLDNSSLDALQLLPQYKLGRDWVPQFIQRHLHLAVVIGRRIDSIQMDRATKPVLEAWFNAYQSIVREYKILEENIYNIDKSGFSIGTMESTQIIIDFSLCTKHQAHLGRQEWVLIVEYIYGDRTAIAPFGIFKGKNILEN